MCKVIIVAKIGVICNKYDIIDKLSILTYGFTMLNQQLNEIKVDSLDMRLGDLKLIQQISDKEIQLIFGFPIATIKEELVKKIQTINQNLKVRLQQTILSHAVQQGLKGLSQVKNIIAVASGKGGVGKSTVTANIALALAHAGAQVGILDADIYGPNQAHMLGITQQPNVIDQKKLTPMNAYGLQVMSMAFLIEQTDTPMIWRGPMVSTALQQLLNDTLWHELDYLLIDLPPGTGDIQLTLAQKIPVSGAIIVSTPQEIALLDARKAIRMFEKVNIPVLGVVENMSTHVCSQCGHEEAIFGEGGAKDMAARYHTEFLGTIPLDRQIRADADAGKPSFIADPASKISLAYLKIALKAAAILAKAGKDHMRRFPKILIE